MYLELTCSDSKIMYNSLFGKVCENMRNRQDIKLQMTKADYIEFFFRNLSNNPPDDSYFYFYENYMFEKNDYQNFATIVQRRLNQGKRIFVTVAKMISKSLDCNNFRGYVFGNCPGTF